MLGLSIQDWVAVGQLVCTIFGFVGVVWTVRKAAGTSNREKSFDAYLYFSEKFDAINTRRRALRDRFHQGDRTVNIHAVRAYFKDYLTLINREWELYRGGVVAREVFTSWTKGTHRYLHRLSPVSYFDDEGREQAMLPREGIEMVVSRSKVPDPDFIAYMNALIALPVPDAPRSNTAWHQAIRAIVSRTGRAGGWTLS